MTDIAIKNVILPNKPLSSFELEDASKRLKIPSFRGVFLRKTVPKKCKKKKKGMRYIKLRSHKWAWYTLGCLV